MADRRESRFVANAKRNSQLLIPYSVVDFRDSWVGDRPAPAYLNRIEEDEAPLTRFETNDTLKDDLKGEKDEEVVLGSTEIFDKDGNLRLVPTPTPDPKDPLNLSNTRKWVAIGCLCFFGSISLAAEIAIAGLIPVFLLEYSGVDPTTVLKHADLRNNPDPLAIVPEGVKPISLAQVSLLATIPMLSNGFATYLLVPLSTAIGRRPVLILTSTFSWAGGFWAGYSTSLTSHIAARVFHGLGSGAVEALLPLIVQDMVFIHQRGKAIAAIISSQGPMIIIFGILGPYVAVNYDWRWIYWITSIIGIFSWILLILYVPETRRQRSKAELAGQQLWPVAPGENRTQLDYATYGERTKWDDLGFFQFGYQWKDAGVQIIDTAKTTVFPAVAWCVLLQTVFGIVQGATGQAISFALLSAGVPFELTGLSNIPQILSTIVVFFLGGPMADKVTLWISKRRGGGREPEYHLPNLIIPLIFAIAGVLIFGYADQLTLHYTILLTGTFFLMTASLTATPVINTYVIESYPQWAGPVLTNVSTLRVFTSFFFNTQVTTWLSQLGPLRFMTYLAIALLVVSSGIPLLFYLGKPLRAKTSGKVEKVKRRNKGQGAWKQID
ncbi:major facilitator superfamily transporter [Xylariaceae sp. FL0016]|nr:major facilitator superfamily transporter [Xylariaceae sp. FL0016]